MAKKNIKAVKTKASASKKSTAKKVVKKAAPVKKKVIVKNVKKVAPKKIVKKVAAPVKKKIDVKPIKKAVTKNLVAKKIVSKKVNKPVKKTTPSKAVAKPISKVVAKTETNKTDKKVEKQSILQSTTVEKKLKKEAPKSTPPPTTNKVKPGSPKRGRKKKNKDDEEDGFDADPAIELEIEMLRAKKRKKNDGPKIIRTPLVIHLGLEDKEIDYAKLLKSTPAPKGKHKKFELEFTINASIKFLFPFFLTPSELADWFADDVDIKGDLYTFFWDGSTQVAKLVAKKENHFVRFKWVDEPDNTYFEFRLEADEITQDVALIISDFAEDDESREASTLLWNNQVEKLMHVIGA
jgi:uncharacterized protein YndB with AHSA1/START domain